MSHLRVKAESCHYWQPARGHADINIGHVVDGRVYLSIDEYEHGYHWLSDDSDDHSVSATAWLTREQAVELIRNLAHVLSTPNPHMRKTAA